MATSNTSKRASTAKAAPAAQAGDEASPREREGLAEGEPHEVQLRDRTIRVPRNEDWPASATSHLANGMITEWAAAVLDDESWAVWEEVDATNGEIQTMFEQLNEVQGVSVGESRASRRLQQRMARR